VATANALQLEAARRCSSGKLLPALITTPIPRM